MNQGFRLTFLLAGLIFSAGETLPTSADTIPLKCSSSQDRIWVYDSLNNFDVAMKLKCGEAVEVVGRAKGYVRIRTQNGTEGYVEDAALPNLPPLEDKDATTNVGSAAKALQAKGSAHPVITDPAITASNSTDSPNPVRSPASVKPSSSTPARASLSVASSTRIVATPNSASSASKPAKAVASDSKTPETGPSAPRPLASDSTNPAPPAPPQTPEKPASAASTTTTESITGDPAPSGAPRVHLVAAMRESDEFPETQPVSESSDPACRLFFSAYGLTPAQFKWIAQNRKKMFASVCPAPDPSKVDFVLIFTHDVDFFASTLPEAIHTDRNGFSDFNPLVTIDSALVPESRADKAHREYVWIFQFNRGAFDPAQFSTRRRYQFSKNESNSVGSKAGPKTIEDAFQFIQGVSVNR
jgi:hypothetical protein